MSGCKCQVVGKSGQVFERGCRRIAILLLAACMLSAGTVYAQDAAGEYIHYRLAVQFKNEGKFDQAIEEFRKVLAAYPDHYNSYLQLAQVYAAQGNHRLVIFNLQRALVYNPGWGRAQLMLAEAYAADGQFDRAVREYQVYQSGTDPAVRDSIQTVINGLMDRMRGGPSPALQSAYALQQAAKKPAAQSASAALPPPVKLDPRAEEAMKKVIALYDQNKYDEMLVAVKEVLAIQPNHPGAYYYAGLVRQHNKQLEMARINYRKALTHPVLGADASVKLRQLTPGGQTTASAPAPAGGTPADTMSEPAVQLEKFTGVEIRIDSMLSMMTVDTITDIGQKLLAGIRIFTEGRYDDALLEFKRVLAENPNGPVAAHCIYNMGICYYRLRLYKDAENQFQSFLDRFGSNRFAPRAAFFKACCFQERGDYPVSERLFRQFIQNNRRHEWVGRAYERLGDSYADLEQYRRAIDAYNQALAVAATPTDKVILNYKLGNSSMQIPENDARALTFFSAAVDIGEKDNVFVRVPDSYYKIADIRFRQKDFASALDHYKRVTRKYPAFQETPWGLFQIAGIHRNLKQYREAVDTYRELMQRYPDDYWAKQAQWKMEDTIWEHEYRSVKR
ncbi:MAG: tetratricopeptide repeat protein [Chitinispirillia bacterium]|nr:tetratricopeptide repeat protein [Chitinispirillia bacterium]MCL2268349.1 tetratricopeptide repeat protein [Chitinispirillia bacterium]